MRLYSRVTDQGTAMSEATLCERHFIKPFIEYANIVADGADDVGGPEWVDTTGNAEVHCVECGLTLECEKLRAEEYAKLLAEEYAKLQAKREKPWLS